MATEHPAPPDIEHRMPTAYLVIGAGSLIATAILIIALAAVAGRNSGTDASTLGRAMGLAIILLADAGLWALSLHRQQVLHDLAGRQAEARADAIERTLAALEASVTEQLRQIRQDVLDVALDAAVTQARRAAHADGYVEGVAARQASTGTNGTNVATGGNLRLVDPDDRA